MIKTNNRYSLQPILFDVKTAHKQKQIEYKKNGDVIVRYEIDGNKEEILVPSTHQFPTIMASFQDLGKALSQTSNSPLLKEKKNLREMYEEEFASYEKMVEQCLESGHWEPDYGSYVFDKVQNELFMVLPEFWHRLGLVTNNSKLLTDQENKKSWQEIRTKFDGAVIGVIGASVGGNLVEGIMREIRPKQMKVADYDWVELTNLNRFERGSIRHLISSRASRFDPKNQYDMVRVNKAELTAYMQQMLDPYSSWYVYPEGLHAQNIERFLIGDGASEPRLDILVEECDDLRLKIELRELARKHNIPVLMMSDFGHMVQGQFQNYSDKKYTSIGYKTTDLDITTSLELAMTSGRREDRFEFIHKLCGEEFENDEFGLWIKGDGEQPTSSLPQSGATAMTSGGIGAKIIALYLLGYSIPERFIYDLKHIKVTVG
ncbi:MAG: hypothetical protein WCO06_02655 [Candidatus Roizmanbacteria bacterium]